MFNRAFRSQVLAVLTAILVSGLINQAGGVALRLAKRYLTQPSYERS